MKYEYAILIDDEELYGPYTREEMLIELDNFKAETTDMFGQTKVSKVEMVYLKRLGVNQTPIGQSVIIAEPTALAYTPDHLMPTEPMPQEWIDSLDRPLDDSDV